MINRIDSVPGPLQRQLIESVVAGMGLIVSKDTDAVGRQAWEGNYPMTVERPDLDSGELDRPEIPGWPLSEALAEVAAYQNHLVSDRVHCRVESDWWVSRSIDDYSRGASEIHVHMRVRFGEGEDEEWCAVFKRAGVPFGLEATGFGTNDNVIREGSDRGDMRKSVLVDVVELGEPPYGHEPLARLESVVRLRLLDRCLCAAVQGTDSPPSFGEALSVDTDRVGQVFVVVGRVESGLMNGEYVDDVVERTPEIVECIPKQNSPMPNVGLNLEVRAEYVSESIGLALSGDSEWVTMAPPVGLAVERCKVFICPRDLGASA